MQYIEPNENATRHLKIQYGGHNALSVLTISGLADKSATTFQWLRLCFEGTAIK